MLHTMLSLGLQAIAWGLLLLALRAWRRRGPSSPTRPLRPRWVPQSTWEHTSPDEAEGHQPHRRERGRVTAAPGRSRLRLLPPDSRKSAK